MARRRINKKVLLILVGGLIVMTGTTMGMWQGRWRQRDPQPYLDRGDQLFKEGKYKQARGQYHRARSWAGRSEKFETQAIAMVKLGQTMSHIDTEGAVGRGLSWLAEAVVKDPKSVYVRSARLEMHYEAVRDGFYLEGWQKLLEYADDVLELASDNARAYYLRGVGMLKVSAIRRESRAEMLADREEALPYFQKACQYQPDSADYHRDLVEIHTFVADLILTLRGPLPPEPEDRQRAVDEHWKLAYTLAQEFVKKYPNSGAGLAVLAKALTLPRAWAIRDERAKVAEDAAGIVQLEDEKLIEAYIQAYRQDSPRPNLSKVREAFNRLIFKHIEAGEKLNSDIVAVQVSLADYWLSPGKEDLGKAIAALEKAAENETETVERLRLCLRIADLYSRDGRREKVITTVEKALSTVSTRGDDGLWTVRREERLIVRVNALDSVIYRLHYFAAQTLVGQIAGVKPTDNDAAKQINDLLDGAEEHLKSTEAIIPEERANFQILISRLILRGKMAQTRQPRTRENIRKAIRLYERARDQMENMGVRNAMQYINLHWTLAQAYRSDAQRGAAEETLSKGLEALRQSSPDDHPTVNPMILLFLADLQLSNRHVEEASSTLDHIEKQLDEDTDLQAEERNDIRVKILMQRIRQFQLQDRPELALETARYIEDNFAGLGEWALSKQHQILSGLPDSETQTVDVLKRWIALNPNNVAPVNHLANLYLKLDQREQAVALLKGAAAANPELQPFVDYWLEITLEEDREKRRKLQIERLMREDTDALQRQISLFQLYSNDRNYYRSEAAKYRRQGEGELAKQALEQASLMSKLAFEALEEAYRVRPEVPQIHEQLFSVYLGQQAWDKVQAVVDKAKEGNWDGVDGLYFLARMHNSKGGAYADKDASKAEYQEAVKCLEEAVRIRPTFFQAWVEKAIAESLLGQHESALDSARVADRQNPNSLRVVRVLLEINAGEWQRAKKADDLVTAKRFADATYQLAERALKLQPNYRQAELYKLSWYDEYDADRAIKERKAILDKNPSDMANSTTLLKIYRRQNQDAQAIALLEEAVQKHPDYPGLVMLLSQLYNAEGQYERALQSILPARQRWPERLDVASSLAQAYRFNKQPEKALGALQEFLKTTKETKQWLVYRALGLLQKQLGLSEKAVISFDKSQSLVREALPGNTAIICELARMMFFSGGREKAMATVQELAEQDDQNGIQTVVQFHSFSAQPDQAIRWARKGVALAPKAIAPKMILARALLGGSKPAEAQKMLEEIIRQMQEDPIAARAYVMLSSAHFMQRKYDQAILVLEDAISSGQSSVEIRWELARQYRFQGKFNEAAQEYKTILRTHTGNVEVRNALVEMLVRQKRFNQAERVLKEGARVQPDSYHWPMQLQGLELIRSDKKPSEERFDKALAYALQAYDRAKDDPAVLVAVMSVFNVRREYDSCIDFYNNKVSEKRRTHHRILLALAQAWSGKWRIAKFGPHDDEGNQLGPPLSPREVLVRQRRSTALFYQVLDKAGGDTDSYTVAVSSLISILGLDNVIKSAEVQVSQNPQDPQQAVFLAALLNSRGGQRMQNNQPAQAREDLSQAIDLLQPMTIRRNLGLAVKLMVYHQLASSYTNLRMDKQAKDVYLNLLRFRPNDFRALNNLAYILSDSQDRPDEALAYIERALQQNPQDSNLLDTYGWTLLKSKHLDRAIIELRRSVEISPSVINHYHLGVALNEAREYELALHTLRQALELLEGNPVQEAEIGQEVRALIAELEKR